jgi:hypothetical protein
MAFYNLPPALSTIMDELDKRLRRLETSYRFTVPTVSTVPANLRNGDMYILSSNSKLYIYYNGTHHQLANL